jgi:trans-2,3-dihydro-3-hydroxyanthranilate isomerase
MAHRFYIVDVFAESKYAGNQLAVVTDAGSMMRDEMQRIAREMNFSETSFLVSGEKPDGSFDVRIFTPASEVPFAGHPTLGTAFVIREELLEHPRDEVVLGLGVGPIPVRFVDPGGERGVLWMCQRSPEFGEQVEHGLIAELLRLELRDVDDRFPVQMVSTGLPFLIVPIRTLAAVRRARIDRERYDELCEKRNIEAIYFFCPQTRDAANQIHARMFADFLGVSEDPATGSACGCLGGYLVRHRYLGRDAVDLRVEQGYEIGRPSLLRVRAREKGETVEIEVGGKVEMVARGELL